MSPGRASTSVPTATRRLAALVAAVSTVAAAAAFAPGASAQEAPQPDPLAAAKRSIGLVGTDPIHCRVTFHRDPAHAAILSWSTAEAGSDHQVHYDTESRGGKLAAYRHTVACQRNGRFTRGSEKLPVEFHYHHAKLGGLQPATVYYCVMVSDGKKSGELRFTTAPADARPIRLLLGGDSRSGHADRQRVNRFLARTLERNPDIVAMVHGGDFVNTGNDLIQWALWLTHHEQTTTRDGRLLPVIPVRGNHEGRHPQFDEAFCWPGGKRNYFATRIGAQTLLVVLNTQRPAAGDQKKFLRRVLARHREVRWQLAAYHRPAFPAVKQPGHALQHWVPEFDRRRIDLAFEADGHVIKRTLPILGRAPHPDGVVYLGEGGLGVKQRNPDARRWYLRPPGMTSKGHHVHLLSISAERLRADVLLLDGSVLDGWQREPRRRPVAVSR